MHTYRFVAVDRLYQVGYYSPDGRWQALHECDSSDAAQVLTARLNGGQADTVEPKYRAPCCGAHCRHEWIEVQQVGGAGQGWRCTRCDALALGRQPAARTPVPDPTVPGGLLCTVEITSQVVKVAGRAAMVWRLHRPNGEIWLLAVAGSSRDQDTWDLIVDEQPGLVEEESPLPPSEGGPIP